MIESTGAPNVSAASSGSRIVRSARSTSNAAASARISPPNRPPSAGRVVAADLDTRSAGVWAMSVAITLPDLSTWPIRYCDDFVAASDSASSSATRSYAMFSP